MIVNINIDYTIPYDPEKPSRLGFPKEWDTVEYPSLQKFLVASGFTEEEANSIYLSQGWLSQSQE